MLPSNPHGERTISLLHHQEHLTPIYSSGLLQDAASIYHTPDLIPHSFQDLYTSTVNQFEYWNGDINGTIPDFSTQWPPPDTTQCQLSYDSFLNLPAFDASDLEASQELLAQPIDRSMFTTPEYGNTSCTSSSPEQFSIQGKSTYTRRTLPI